MYTLYYGPGTASMCVHQALIETGAPYQLVLVDLKAGQQRDPAYLKLNPNGLVLTLLIEGGPLTEAAALLMMIATRHPHAGSVPAEPSGNRAAWHQWTIYLANTLQPAFRLWLYPTDISDDENTQSHTATRCETTSSPVPIRYWNSSRMTARNSCSARSTTAGTHCASCDSHRHQVVALPSERVLGELDSILIRGSVCGTNFVLGDLLIAQLQNCKDG